MGGVHIVSRGPQNLVLIARALILGVWAWGERWFRVHSKLIGLGWGMEVLVSGLVEIPLIILRHAAFFEEYTLRNI